MKSKILITIMIVSYAVIVAVVMSGASSSATIQQNANAQTANVSDTKYDD